MTDILEIDESEELLRSKPVTQYEVLQLVQPLRGVVQDLLVSYIDVAAELIKSAKGEKREAFMEGFEKLGYCFDGINDFDLKVQRLLNGLDIDDESIDAPTEDNADE
ncbi:hypothetical protein [Pseudomonas syringae pv. coryli]|uniref:hypothetical protein n=1 Tax=Pseudomonas syringae pv. coryli TaxID=317659 RepID=UPI003D2C4437